MRYTHVLGLSLLSAAFLQCASLTPYAANECGNRVVDANEDCDESTDDNPQCVSCRLRCEGAVTCPLGWGCGADKICRQPTGRLEEATAAVSSNVFALKAGDFDGDGRTDVLGLPAFGSAGSSRVHYFDRNAVLSTATPLDVAIPIPIVRDLDGDGVDDVGFAVRGLVSGAFAALAGQRDRTFSTIVFPSVTLEAESSVAVITASGQNRLPDSLPSCGVAIVTTGSENFLINICESNVAALRVPIGIKAGDVLGTPLVGRLFPELSTCGQIVFRTKEEIHIVSPCDGAGAWRKALLEVVIDVRQNAVDGLFLGEVTRPGTDELYARSGTRFAVLDKNKLEDTSIFNVGTGLPLATGDLDGDGLVDFVFSTGMRLSLADPLTPAGVDAGVKDAGPGGDGRSFLEGYRIVRPRDQLRWSAARIGRFNSDELPDVLVSFNDSLDVDVMGNVGGGRFTAFSVRSEQIVRGITSGDFDGDRIDDVAFFQSASELGTADADVTLTLAFGRAVGGPEAPATAGKFKNARALNVLRSDSGTDNVAVVQVSSAAPQSTSISVLFGNGGRQPVAPLFMTDTQFGRTWQPSSFSIGAIEKPDTPAILALGGGAFFEDRTDRLGFEVRSPITGAWISRQNTSLVGGFSPFSLAQQLQNVVAVDTDALQGGARQLRLVTTLGDLDGDRVDEVVSLAALDTAPSEPKKFLAGVVVVRAGVPSFGLQIPDGRVREGDAIQLVDLDKDGALDLVFTIGFPNPDPDPRKSALRFLYVLRGDGAGGFVTTAITSEGTGIAPDVQGFATLDTGKATKLAVVSGSELWLVELGEGEAQLRAENVSAALGASTAGLSSIVGGDFNGDGVPDLAIAQGGGVRVIRQAPTVE